MTGAHLHRTASARVTFSDPSLRFAPAFARGETPFRMTACFTASPTRYFTGVRSRDLRSESKFGKNASIV